MAVIAVVTFRMSDLESTRLLIWTLWQLVHEMRVAGPYTTEFAHRLEKALDRYVNTFGPDSASVSEATEV